MKFTLSICFHGFLEGPAHGASFAIVEGIMHI